MKLRAANSFRLVWEVGVRCAGRKLEGTGSSESVDSDVTASRVDGVDGESTEWGTAVNDSKLSAFLFS